MKTATALILSFFMSPQLVFPKGGLLSGYFLSHASFCRCNHNTRKEIHQSEEDLIFKDNAIGKISNRAESSSRPNCHSEAAPVGHECKCKKNQSDATSFQLNLHAYYIIVSEFSFNLVSRTFILCNFPDSDKLQGGHFEKLIRPPETPFFRFQ